MTTNEAMKKPAGKKGNKLTATGGAGTAAKQGGGKSATGNPYGKGAPSVKPSGTKGGKSDGNYNY